MFSSFCGTPTEISGLWPEFDAAILRVNGPDHTRDEMELHAGLNMGVPQGARAMSLFVSKMVERRCKGLRAGASERSNMVIV